MSTFGNSFYMDVTVVCDTGIQTLEKQSVTLQSQQLTFSYLKFIASWDEILRVIYFYPDIISQLEIPAFYH